MKRNTTPSGDRQVVLLGMSGGVDSTIAALRLLQAGHRVIGVTMQIWDGAIDMPDLGRSGCFGPGEANDIAQAGIMAKRLGIKHYVIPLAAEYRDTIIDYVRREYLAGRTPNPCVRCNHRMKFGFLLDRARQVGLAFDAFATGHYARIGWDAERKRYGLWRARDPAKDQSYFLSHLNQPQLGSMLLPLGGLTKDEVRALAREQGWHDLASRPESQDFIESDDYGVLFEPHERRSGPIQDASGRKVGEHQGIVHYTIGQRRGLRLGGQREPQYVTGLDPQTNTLEVGPRKALLADTFKVVACNWIALAQAPSGPLQAQVAIRQRHRPSPARLQADPFDAAALNVTFDTPQSAVTPGQTAVFYDGDAVIGGGTIESVLKAQP